MKLVINSTLEGITVFELLEKKLDFSHRAISRLKRLDNGIMLNGMCVTVRALLKPGDILELLDEDRESDENAFVVPVFHPLDILYEDEYIIVPDKPPGMPTHTSMGHHEDSLANALAYYFKDKPFVFRAVNRLDRNTSGIVIAAKDRHTARKLSEQIAAGKVTKKYLALLEGAIVPEHGVIETGIRRSDNSIITREACEKNLPGSQTALTFYSALTRLHGMSLVECEPKTGRTHQLRVHFYYLGYPIVGDTLYGAPSPLISRQALHAFSVSFSHPITGEPITVNSPLPADISNIIKGN